jgi:hypothetical protein
LAGRLSGVQIPRFIMRAAPIFNAPVVPLTRSPRWGRFLGRTFAMVTYTGRKSGRVISLPVGYRRTGDGVVIIVSMPDANTWWRNFLGELAASPLTCGSISRSRQLLRR